jgi:hypothetical protein
MPMRLVFLDMNVDLHRREALLLDVFNRQLETTDVETGQPTTNLIPIGPRRDQPGKNHVTGRTTEAIKI